MAGHSKWSQIKRTKAVVDAKRGAVFTRLRARDQRGSQSWRWPRWQLPAAPPSKAKAAGVPATNIERAIAKGCGARRWQPSLKIRYEGYGPGGVAVLVEVLSDNRNRTAAELRLAFNKNGGNLGESGCVGFLFHHRSEVTLIASGAGGIDENALLEDLLVLEADGYELTAEGALVHGPSPHWKPCKTCAAGAGRAGRATMASLNSIDLQQRDQARQCLQLLEALEALDDVRSVSCNLGEIPELETRGLGAKQTAAKAVGYLHRCCQFCASLPPELLRGLKLWSPSVSHSRLMCGESS